MPDYERFTVEMWKRERPDETTLGQYKDWLDEKCDSECVADGTMVRAMEDRLNA